MTVSATRRTPVEVRLGVAEQHFARAWEGRNDDRVVVFANGHVYDRAERRKAARALIGMIRRERAW